MITTNPDPETGTFLVGIPKGYPSTITTGDPVLFWCGLCNVLVLTPHYHCPDCGKLLDTCPSCK